MSEDKNANYDRYISSTKRKFILTNSDGKVVLSTNSRDVLEEYYAKYKIDHPKSKGK